MGMRRLIVFLLLIAVLSLPSTSWSRTLKVLTLHAPPLAFEKDGQIVGITADLVREGLERMGHEAIISIVPWKRAIYMTQWGEADAILQASGIMNETDGSTILKHRSFPSKPFLSNARTTMSESIQTNSTILNRF